MDHMTVTVPTFAITNVKTVF